MNSFRPHLVLLASNYQLGDEEAIGVTSDVVHESVRLVFGEKNSQISDNTVVGALERNTNLE